MAEKANRVMKAMLEMDKNDIAALEKAARGRRLKTEDEPFGFARDDKSMKAGRFVVALAFDLQPNLKGELLELRPLAPNDWDELFAVASDSTIWEQHPERDRYEENVFRVFFKEALESGGAFVIIDRKTQQIIGSTRFYGYDPEKSEIEIGWTFLARKYWGGRYNAEMKRLLLNHAFRFVESVVFFVGENNVRSQRAMEKVGAIKVGTVTRAYGNHPPATNVKYLIKKTMGVER